LLLGGSTHALAERLGWVVKGGELGAAKIDVEAAFWLVVVIDEGRSEGRFGLNRNDAVVSGAVVEGVWVIEVEEGVHFWVEDLLGLDVRGVHEFRPEIGVRDEPGGCVGVVGGEGIGGSGGVVGGDDEAEGGSGGGLDDGVGGVEERLNGDAVVAAREGVGRVDVWVARDTESGGVSLARDSRGGLLADLAHPDALVARRQLVGAVNLGVASDAEKSGIGAAEKRRRSQFAGVTWLWRHGPAAPEPLQASSFNSHGLNRKKYFWKTRLI